MAGNERLRGYVDLLEQHYDSRIDEVVGDTDLAAHLEEFLADGGDDPDDE